ncbi:KTSC domain-containing protein [Terrilactibacillus sp. BCM23-1]|uniref:KTSC domain-containing protein n=2 Tax=Terrilactibacillus tamarindi TaxID=2599694 RepID=A0A6N8CTY6_9BACI|nr:KTSC domain-containing protein [Terrilactibacillus tamarindi]
MVMNYTTFNRALSELTSFDTIGYDRKTMQLKVLFFDGSTKIFTEVAEKIIYEFLLTDDKENYYQTTLRQFPTL